jgi:hypothetical protein
MFEKFKFIGAFILPPITPKINGLLFSCSILLLKTKVILGLQGNALPHEQSTALSSGLDFPRGGETRAKSQQPQCARWRVLRQGG